MAGVVRMKLSELKTELSNGLIIALVTSKSEPHFFLAKDSHEYRGVVTYTVRDSLCHLVNCKFWGSKEKVAEYSRKIKIGDIVDIICPTVIADISIAIYATNQLAAIERFQPLPTLPYTLVLNEGRGFLSKHDYRDVHSINHLQNLLNVSHKPLSSVLNLADVHGSTVEGQTQAQFVDLLVAVALVRPIKEIKNSRTGHMYNCLELVVFDRSFTGGMILTIWNSDWINRAQQYWVAMKTVLHLIDVRVNYSDFHKNSVLSFAARTLAYENPSGMETQSLAKFAAMAPSKDFDIFAQAGIGNLPQPDQIRTQMTVKQIYARAEGNLKDNSEQFTVVLYAMVTKFDIDGQSLIISRKCKNCQHLVMKDQIICPLEQCQLAFSMNYSADKYDQFFNINVHFSDHTGTLVEARLSSTVAERILDVKVDKYLQMTDHQKEQLKWRYLMNHFESKLLVKKPTAVRRNLAVIVVDMREIQLDELSEKMSAF